MNEQTTKRPFVGIAAAIALLSLSYAAVQYVRVYEKTIEPGNFRSFSVTAEGTATAKPDIATFSFTVISEGGTDLGALRTDNTEKINAITAFIKEKGVEEKDVKTTEYSISPRYTQCYAYMQPSGVCPPPKIVGYTVQQTTAVKVRNFDIVGDLLAGVADNGANSVSQLQFSIEDETTIQAEARNEAIEKAQAKAQEIASAGGFGVGKILSINEGYSYPYNEMAYSYKSLEMDSAMGIGGAAPTVAAGSQEITVTITMTYEIR